MTIRNFIAMIGEAETGGLKSEDDRLRAIGDHGLAGGYYQQHWAWRVDYWPAWAWAVLRALDRIGLENFCAKHPRVPAQDLADMYNLGHLEADPQYDTRCQTGLAKLGIDAGQFLTIVRD